MAASAESERVRRIWERLARRYDEKVRVPERFLFAGGREWVCSRAEGDVLEISVGTGRNLPLYARDARITGIDISAAMLEIARARAAEIGCNAELRVDDAQALELPDESFDTVVCTLALCSIPDARAAVAEMRRVLRPGGRVLLLEHVRSPRPVVRTIQRMLSRSRSGSRATTSSGNPSSCWRRRRSRSRRSSGRSLGSSSGCRRESRFSTRRALRPPCPLHTSSGSPPLRLGTHPAAPWRLPRVGTEGRRFESGLPDHARARHRTTFRRGRAFRQHAGRPASTETANAPSGGARAANSESVWSER